jgi:hypothetical protein
VVNCATLKTFAKQLKTVKEESLGDG